MVYFIALVEMSFGLYEIYCENEYFFLYGDLDSCSMTEIELILVRLFPRDYYFYF